jgi:hypothetical protein
MKEILCPKCGMQAIGADGFWSTSKPYCSYCGWNVSLAKEVERTSLKKLPWSLFLFAAFFGCIAYFSKAPFALLPFFFLSLFSVASAIATWRRLKLLQASHPAAAYATALSSVKAAEEETRHDRGTAYRYLLALTKPRPVRLRPFQRAISVAFPISWIFIVYFGFQIIRDGLAASSQLTTLTSLGPLFLFASLWSVIGVATIRDARRDRRLLAEGDLAIGIVTHQELSGGRHRRSKIIYEFKDTAGRQVQGEGTDESREFYEDMTLPVFYNPANPRENVALATASCELENH